MDFIEVWMLFIKKLIPVILLYAFTAYPIHEMGHYLAIKHYGGLVTKVHLINGKPVIKWRSFNLGINFFKGAVVHWEPESIPCNKKRANIAIAGPLAELVYAVALVTVGIILKLYILLWVAGVCVLAIVLEMIPRKKNNTDGNDGYRYFHRRKLSKEQ